MDFEPWVMETTTFLELTPETIEHHQVLKAKGKIQVYTPELAARPMAIISHQWLSYEHPDPDGIQLKCRKSCGGFDLQVTRED